MYKHGKKFLILSSLLTLNSMSTAVTAELYKWTDEKGRVHYSNSKPETSKSIKTFNSEELQNRNVVPSESNSHNRKESVDYLDTTEDDSKTIPENSPQQERSSPDIVPEKTQPTTPLKVDVSTVASSNSKTISEKEQQVREIKAKAQVDFEKRIVKASQEGLEHAQIVGVTWTLGETTDPMTDDKITYSQAMFSAESQLNVGVSVACNVNKKELAVQAVAVNSQGQGIPFIPTQRNVNLLVKVGSGEPFTVSKPYPRVANKLSQLEDLAQAECLQKINSSPFSAGAELMSGMNNLFAGLGVKTPTPRGFDKPLGETPADDMILASLAVPEHPDVSCAATLDFKDPRKNNRHWLSFTELRIQFPLVGGSVIARITPYEQHLYTVFKSCM